MDLLEYRRLATGRSIISILSYHCDVRTWATGVGEGGVVAFDAVPLDGLGVGKGGLEEMLGGDSFQKLCVGTRLLIGRGCEGS